MACDLTRSRSWECKDNVGGIAAVYFIDYGDIVYASVTYDLTDTDSIATTGGAQNAYKYTLKNGSSFTQNFVSDPATGTTYWEQVLEVSLPKLTQADHKELKLLTYGRPHVVIEDNNGKFFLAGLQHGLTVTGGTVVSGTAMGDMSGYTLTMTGMEIKPANFIDATLTAAGITVI